MISLCIVLIFFFFKQKTAYEMRISDWSSDVCSSDLLAAVPSASPRYRLVVRLDDDIQGFGVRTDDTITRERRTLRARYQLVEIGKGTVVLDATDGSDAGIDGVSFRRSEERLVGKECVSKCLTRWSPDNSIKNKILKS